MDSFDHNHPAGVTIEAGKLEIARQMIIFSKGMIYKDLTSMEQRVCLTMECAPDPRLVRSATRPFAKVHLDQPIFIQNFPISHLGVFLLSASISGNLIDVVISPIIEKLDPLLRN